MAKKIDIKFEDEAKFLSENPSFAIISKTPNYSAIRAVLRAGGTLQGVELVELPAALPSATKVAA